MLIRRPSDILPSEITRREVWQRRRTLLRAALAATGAAVLPAAVRAAEKLPELRKSPLSTEEEPTDYEHVVNYNNFYEFGYKKPDPAERAKEFRTRPWSVRITGACEAPGEIGVEDLLRLFPQEERIYRLRCVEAWAMVIPWVGFPLSSLLQRFRPTSEAKYVAFETLYDPERMPGQRTKVLDWPYREGLRIDEALHPLTILATGLYGEILPNQNGAPLRLVVPWKYGFKSIKSIVAIHLQQHQPPTSWNALSADEYGFFANVNPEIDHPRWSQKYHRNIGDGLFAAKRETRLFNGYATQVGDLYSGMDLKKFF